MMRSIVFLLLTLISANAFAVYAQERAYNGYLFVRVINDQPLTLNCYIQDQAGYYHYFWLYPNSAGRWYPVAGAYRWRCR